jgi:hypothetical protein
MGLLDRPVKFPGEVKLYRQAMADSRGSRIEIEAPFATSKASADRPRELRKKA